MFWKFWCRLTACVSPFFSIFGWVHRVFRPASRLPERYGFARHPRPAGMVVWIHAVSVGEIRTAFRLADALTACFPASFILLTSRTTSSALFASRYANARSFHQYAPLDLWGCVERFLAHWRPSFAIWIESEFWPVLLSKSRGRMALFLVQGRLSDKSFRRWSRLPGLARDLLRSYRACYAATPRDVGRLEALGARRVRYDGNLKYDRPLLKVDPELRTLLASLSSGRRIWAAVSTHRGEEEGLLELFAARRDSDFPILVPRHPPRAPEVCRLLEASGLSYARRSQSSPPSGPVDVFLLDSFDELGPVFSLAPVVFMGGTMVPVGGHNLIEPASFGCLIFVGPHHWGVSSMMKDLGQQVQPMASFRDLELFLAQPQRVFSEARVDSGADAGAGSFHAGFHDRVSPLLSQARGLADRIVREIRAQTESPETSAPNKSHPKSHLDPT